MKKRGRPKLNKPVLELKEGNVYHIDTYAVQQYKGTRIVDDVKLLETPKHNQRIMLVYSPYLMANVRLPRRDLKAK